MTSLFVAGITMLSRIGALICASTVFASMAVAQPADLFGDNKKFKPIIEPMHEAPLTATSAPRMHSSRVDRGGSIASQRVRHTITGVLASAVTPRGLFAIGKKSMPTGTQVYAMPYDHGLTWCAPEKVRSGYWTTICLPRDAEGKRRWATNYAMTPALFVDELVLDDAPLASEPRVERRPVDFGVSMEILYRFVEWDMQDADVHVLLVAGDAEWPLERRDVPRQADGSATFDVFGGMVRLSPIAADPTAATIEVLQPPVAHGLVAP